MKLKNIFPKKVEYIFSNEQVRNSPLFRRDDFLGVFFKCFNRENNIVWFWGRLPFKNKNGLVLNDWIRMCENVLCFMETVKNSTKRDRGYENNVLDYGIINLSS